MPLEQGNAKRRLINRSVKRKLRLKFSVLIPLEGGQPLNSSLTFTASDSLMEI